MNVFNEKVAEKGFINKNELLKYVSEEDIFELVFGFKPEEYDYVTSPFREDSSPGCWFFRSYSGKLRFADFGSNIYSKGVKMVVIDCFDAVQNYFKLQNLYQTLKFIKKTLIDGKNLPAIEIAEIKVKTDKELKEKPILQFLPRPFTIFDKKFWFDRYQIYKENLIEDKVFPVENYKFINSKFGDFKVTPKTLSYCYTDFNSNNLKIYRPFEKSGKKFVSTCNKNDIGGINFLPDGGDQLVITKSYKDYRVLRNQGIITIWLQNEGMIPSLEILLPLCQKFNKIRIFFDNDNVGIEAAEKITKVINSYIPNKASNLYLPIEYLKQDVKDPADFIYKYGRQKLIEFLIHKQLI